MTSNSQRAGMGPSHNDIVRFLEQATFGPTPEAVQDLEQRLGGDYNAWLDEQFTMAGSSYPTICCSGNQAQAGQITCEPVIPCTGDLFLTLDAYPETLPRNCGATCQRDNYSSWKLQQLFYKYALTAPDQLRQRVMFALSQILVTSGSDDNLKISNRLTGYLQFLEDHAFSNFRDTLYDLSRNPTMGRYLDNITNNKDEPNENYAREIMQLFSIGLVVLNPDGTTDQTPTYTQDTVIELTRALTGWVNAPRLGEYRPPPPPDVPPEDIVNYRDPLVADESRHDTGVKVLFRGTQFEQTIPAGQNTEQDLRSAIDALFNHPNTGTFIGKALIQMLVTSNPSREYVTRVTNAFNTPGDRGNMKTVIRAILTDDEARITGAPGPNYGKLREPVLAVTNLLRDFNTYRGTPPIATTDWCLSDWSFINPAGTPTTYLAQGEDVFRAPSVFNFFPPDFAIPGEDPTLIGPEFGILSTSTALSRANLFYQLIFNGINRNGTWRPNGTMLDTTALVPLASDPSALVDQINVTLLHGGMSNELHNLVRDAISGEPDMPTRVKEAVYLISSSPEFLVQR